MRIDSTYGMLKESDTMDKRKCGNCKWWAENEVCCNGDSSYDGYSADIEFFCECHEFKEMMESENK